jgi:hypothetical protein
MVLDGSLNGARGWRCERLTEYMIRLFYYLFCTKVMIHVCVWSSEELEHMDSFKDIQPKQRQSLQMTKVQQ